jgi:glycogen debranching enzyme
MTSSSQSPAGARAEVRGDAAVSPAGERFEIVGRAGPVELRGAPYIPTDAREDLLVVKEGALFLCARPDGEVCPGLHTGEGLYMEDMRHLSELRLTIGGMTPVMLSSSADWAYAAVVDATNPDLRSDGALVAAQQTINLQRYMLIRDRLYLRLSLRNFGADTVTTPLRLRLGADFADMFEVRGTGDRAARGHALAPKRTRSGLTLAYVGEDGRFRETVVRSTPAGALTVDQRGATLEWDLALAPHEEQQVLVTIEPRAGDRPARASLETATRRTRQDHRSWRASCATISTDNQLYDRVLEASLRDLHALVTPVPGRQDARAFAAGIPWFVALFGRDSLLTCYESLIANCEVARQTLFLLASFQAGADDPWRDAEPGKILHELRAGELASAGLIPHTPYYGTVDATPLFVMLAAAYYRWTNDVDTMAALRPALDRALAWIDVHGDRDGDGFVEYQRRSPGGLVNQGWKDSGDCIVHADGSLADGPIALVEVQGYVYMAKSRIADVYDALGARDVAGELRAQAHRLRDAFNDVFWDPQEGTFAIALDGHKQRVRSVTSNPGHCLYCGIVDDDKAAAVAERLMAPDMYSGWGVRTLSSDNPAYNPMSYHNGSVWPHDNAIVAAGLKRYGHTAASTKIAETLFEVAAGAADYRLPELFCGFGRQLHNLPVGYPVACSPQAWASAAPFMLLQALLGISARAEHGLLTVHEPHLPGALRRVDVDGLRVGDSEMALTFHREFGTTTFSLRRQTGDARVVLVAEAEA